MTGQELHKITPIATDIQKLTGNPFPGLRSFVFEESHLYFGQDQLITHIIQKLKAHKFVCLLGGAGVGKTSLINCGIKPILYSGLFEASIAEWQIFHTTPGDDPLRNLAQAFHSDQKKKLTKAEQEVHEQICYNILYRGKQGLTELISQDPRSSACNYLFIIDQFEDLFRSKTYASDIENYEEAIHYVNLFIEALNSTDYNINVVMSIRSDFTDDCIIFPNLANHINKSNILIPKMTREQVREAIQGPLRTMKIKIDDSLMAQLLNEATIAEDMLPRLQHSMRLTWDAWMSLNNRENPITIKEYEVGGGMKDSVSNHANAIYDELTENDKKICEVIFKSLTERGSENKGLLRATTISELAGIAKTDNENIIRIVELFRKEEAGFLVSSDGILQAGTLVNLSHVSLLRLWNRLKVWVEDEAISGQMYKRLSETSAAYQVGKTGLLTSPDLQFAINWKEKQSPTLQWARRYNPAYERTMVYLRTSLEKHEAEETLKSTRAKRALRKIRSISIVLGTTAIFAIMLTVYSQIVKRNAQKLQRIALEEKKEADAKSHKAEIMSKEALEEKWRAELAADEAEKSKKVVLEESKMLAEQKSQAEVFAQEAIKKNTETEINLFRVSKQKEQIEQNAIQANLQKKEAEKDKEETFKKRLLTAAQTIASKSLQVQGNKNLKTVLALHSYTFNNRYGGLENPPDIYYALNAALTEQGISARYNFKGHIGSVKSLTVSAKSNILYSTGGDGNVYAWNLHEATPTPRIVYKNTEGNLSLSLSNNGRWLALGTESGLIKVVDLNNMDRNPAELKGHLGPVYALAFSKDGQQIFSTGADKKVLTWDVATGVSTVVFHENTTIRSISLSADNKFLAGGADDGRILLWDIATNQLITLRGEDVYPIYSVAFNKNGTLLASGDIKGGIKLWNPYAHKIVKVLKNHTARVVDITFSSTNDLMTSSSYDGTAYIFDTRFINNPPIVIKEPATWILTVAFSNDNKKLIMGTNKPDYIFSMPAQTKVMSDLLCGKVSRGLTTEEWNFYIGNDVKYEKPCE